MMISSKNNGFGKPIVVQIPRVKQPIPLFIVFRALGVISDKEICEYILLNLAHEKCDQMLQNLQASIIEAHKYNNKEDAIRFIMSFVIYTPINMDKETGARKKYEFTLDVLNNDLFPHCHTVQQKIYFLGYMTNVLLQTNFGWIKGVVRDSFLNKRVDLTGASLNNFFRNPLVFFHNLFFACSNFFRIFFTFSMSSISGTTFTIPAIIPGEADNPSSIGFVFVWISLILKLDLLIRN
jgi:DNA-directed RNA polymerase II subunit RPB2